MPELVPFPALRFTEVAGDLSLLLAPPYDVIDEPDAVALRERSEHNCVRLILPEGSAEERYRIAAETLERWTSEGILALDPRPSAYVYRQQFEVDGQTLERLALFAAVRLTPFEAGEILPHERTHAGPKKDRLALTLATRTQLSPIFMVARDDDGSLYRLQTEALRAPPAAEAATPDGIRHSLVVISGAQAEALVSAAGARPLLIADGHHRYETALVAAELLGDSVKAAYLLICVVSQQDPGLIVRPTHRILSRPPEAMADGFDWISTLAASFRLEDLGALDAAEAEHRAGKADPGAFIVCPGGASSVLLASPHPQALAVAGIPPERSRIAAVVFDELVLGGLYGLDADAAAHEGVLAYTRNPEPAGSAPPGGCGFILPPVSLGDVWATAARGGRLPPKSTYFEPKMPSGLLFRPL